jgi:DNA recombination protein RmuC
MQIDTIVLLLGLFIGFGMLGFLLLTQKKNTSSDATLVEWLSSLQRSMELTNKSVSEALRGQTAETSRVLMTNTKQMNERLDVASQVIGDLKKNLGEMSEIGRGIKNLQEFLQSPKLRGTLGEEVLSDMIGQMFPKQSFFLQYQFRSGTKVDAAIKTEAGILPIDAKFPMTNFTRMMKDELEADRDKYRREFVSDVKKHIQDISKKYILPDEGTLDFALMYIPSEAVYYEIVTDVELMNLSRQLRIYPVSPNTLYAHLQVLLVSFEGKELEKKSHEVMKTLRSIAIDMEKLDEQFSILSRHITNAYNASSGVGSAINQLGQKVEKTKLISGT